MPSQKYIACHNAVLIQYSLLAESSRVLTRTLSLLFTVTLVLSMRVTLPPSFTEYTSGSKYTPATTHKGRGPSSEVSTKVVYNMQLRKSKQPYMEHYPQPTPLTPHLASFCLLVLAYCRHTSSLAFVCLVNSACLHTLSFGTYSSQSQTHAQSRNISGHLRTHSSSHNTIGQCLLYNMSHTAVFFSFARS